MNKKSLFLSLAAAVLMASCSQDELAENQYTGDGLAMATTQSFTAFDEEGETRSVIDLSGPIITFKWATGDKLAIYSGGEASGMTNFDLVDGANSEVATFKANGFLLTEGASYFAFTPYDGNQTDKTKIAFDYNGQVQAANGTFSHLGAKDFQYSTATTATSKNPGKLTNFDLMHLGAICRFQLTVPEAGVFTEFTLSGKALASEGTFNITDATRTYKIDEEGSISLSLVTSSSTGISVVAGGVITLYLMLPQQDLSGKDLTATLSTADKTYSAKLNGKNIVGGKAYGWTADVKAPAPPHDYVEIGGKKWATMNLGATTVAGSYATCAGDFYAWGETTPRYTSISWSGTSASFSGWKSGFSSGYKTYPSYTGTTPDAAHDAVTSHADWGEGWRTPTHQDFKDLYAACGGTGSYISSTLPTGSKSTTAKGIYWCSNYDGVAGLLFCDGTNKLFFPASGLVSDTSHYYGGSYGYYWSSSLYSSNTYYAYYLYFYSSSVNPSNYGSRYLGFQVRPVSD